MFEVLSDHLERIGYFVYQLMSMKAQMGEGLSEWLEQLGHLVDQAVLTKAQVGDGDFCLWIQEIISHVSLAYWGEGELIGSDTQDTCPVPFVQCICICCARCSI